MKDIRDVITHAKFGDDRLRGSGVLAGQISAFPIDFAGRPNNTLTLLCERVILIGENANCLLFHSVRRCVLKITNFRYRGNKGLSEANLTGRV